MKVCIPKFIKVICLLIAKAIILSACVGDIESQSTSTPVAPAKVYLTGIAAAGTPLAGTVTLKDSGNPAGVKTVAIDTGGKYTVDVTGLIAPFMVRADGYAGGQSYSLYSLATAADIGGTINITPLTDLMVANLTREKGSRYCFDNAGSFATLSVTQLNDQAKALKTILAPLLQVLGVNSDVDLLRSAFAADHTGLDLILDLIKLTTDPLTHMSTIKNIVTNQTVTLDHLSQSYSGSFTDLTGMNTVSADIHAIGGVLKTFAGFYSTSTPSANNLFLLALFDEVGFLENGNSLASFIADLNLGSNAVGMTLNLTAIQAFDVAQGTAIATFDLIPKKGSTFSESWSLCKRNGNWLLLGNQRITRVGINNRAEYYQQPNWSSIVSSLDLTVSGNPTGNSGITSVVVSGKGLPGGAVTLVCSPLQNDCYRSETGDHVVILDEATAKTIVDDGESYTFDLYSNNVLKASYVERLRKAPFISSALAPGNFPVITPPNFSLGAGTINWKLPPDYVSSLLETNLSDLSGHVSTAQYLLDSAALAKSVTLEAKTANGVSFTPSNETVSLTSLDYHGRIMITHLSALATTVSGTATAGAPLAGIVTLKDSSIPAITKTAVIAVNGKYVVDVAGMKAPFLMRADGQAGGNSYSLYSFATSSDVGGTINITPLTDLMVANLAAAKGARYYFDQDGSFASFTASQMNKEADALRGRLLPVVQAIGVSDTVDLLRVTLTGDHTGPDLLLDLVRVASNSALHEATIRNIVTQQTITLQHSNQNYSGTLSEIKDLAAAVLDIQAINGSFNALSNFYATGVPIPANPSLRALFAEAFMENGRALESFISSLNDGGNMVGVSFAHAFIQSLDAGQGTALVAFELIRNGRVLFSENWAMRKNNGNWLFLGNQQPTGNWPLGGNQQLTGTVAAGRPLTGQVTLKDSSTPAVVKTVPIVAGSYIMDVDGLKAPFMLKAEGRAGDTVYALYSAATAADVGGTINITPFTDLIVSHVAGAMVTKTYFDYGNFYGVTVAQLDAKADELKAKLLPVLRAIGLPDTIDLLRASFAADHTGLDAVLDQFQITTNLATQVAIIRNIVTQEQITFTPGTGYSGTFK